METGKWMMMALVLLMSAGAYAQRHDGRSKHGGRGHEAFRRGGDKNFSAQVIRVTQADSLQKKKLQPALDKVSKRLEGLRVSYQKQEKRVLDSLDAQLKPVLKEEQLKRWDDFKYHRYESKSK
jgi:hypothetical protein